ncbi:MAG: hypothetical protein Q9167_004190 [Letrouitia subvulpina]
MELVVLEMFLAILTAGLSLTSALRLPFDFPHSIQERSLVQRSPGNGGGPGRGGSGHETRPEVPRPKTPEQKDPAPGRGGDKAKAKDREEVESLHRDPPYEKGYDFHVDREPKKGTVALRTDDKKKEFHLYYGDKTPRHGPIRLKVASDSKKTDQRKNSLRYLLKRPGTVLDEKPAASLDHDDWWTTVVRVSSSESQYEGAMYRQMKEFVKKHPEYSVVYHDWRSDAVKADMNKQMKNGELQFYRGPKVDGIPSPKHQTADFTSGVSRDSRSRSPKIVDSKDRKYRDRDHKSKRGIVENIQHHDTKEGSHQDSNDQYRDQIDEYLDAFSSVQKNASIIVQHFIDNMLATSNSSLVYEAAFAVYAHITMAPVSISGPFAYGMHGFDEYEDQLIASGASEDTMTLVYAIDGILIDLYQTAWDNATEAANANGLLDDLEFLSDYLTPKDQSLLPKNYDKIPYEGDDPYSMFLPPEDRFVSATANVTKLGLNETMGSLQNATFKTSAASAGSGNETSKTGYLL